jgi:hypothetical protein
MNILWLLAPDSDGDRRMGTRRGLTMQGLGTLARRALHGRRNQYECVTCGLAFDSNRTDCPACGGRITRWTTDSEGTP